MANPPLYGAMQSQTAPQRGRRRFQGSQAQQGGMGGPPPMLQQPQQPNAPDQNTQPSQQGQQGGGNQSQQQQGGWRGGGGQPAMTFAQMQQNGLARPAPPPQYQQGAQGGQNVQAGGNPQNALSQSITQALQNPSAYGAPQVQQTFDMLNQQLGQGYDYQRKQLNEELAGRGLSESTIAGQRYSDLATEQSRAQANLATQLATQAAQTYGQDRTAAQQSGLSYGNLGVNQGQLDLNKQLGLGGLGLQAGALTGSYGGAPTLAQQQLNQSGSQFQQSQGQQNQQFMIQQALAQALGMGGLGVQQGQLDLSKTLGMGNLGLEQQAQQNQQQQFGQTFGLSQLQNQQQYGLQSQAQDLAKTLGLGNLNLQNQQLQQQGQQFGQTFGLQQQAQNAQQQQFKDQLAQQLGLATMSDKTANRGVDAQAALAQNDLMLKVMSLLNQYGGGGGGGTGTGGGGGGSVGGGTGGSGGTSGGGQPSISDVYALWDKVHPGQSPPAPGSKQLQDFWNQYGGGGGTSTQTVNYGGKQYTPSEWQDYIKQNPNWSQAQGPGAGQDLSWLQQGQGFDLASLLKRYQGSYQNMVQPRNAGTVKRDATGAPIYYDENGNYNGAPQRADYPTDGSQASTDAYNYNTAQNDAANNLGVMLSSGGLFTDTMPKGMTVGGSGAPTMSTQDYINEQLKQMGFVNGKYVGRG
jgi:hypothetical protein